MDKIRFAILGCGHIAQRHATQAQRTGELVGVCDIVESRARLLADKFQTDFFTDLDGLLQIPFDVAVICTPNGLHAAHAIQCLEQGRHVLVEKPMALQVEDCHRMVEASKKAGKQLFTVMQNRFNPPVMAVKKALDKKAFGKISSVQLTCLWNRGADYYRNTWRGTREMDGGILFTQFSHFIDLLYWFFGDVKHVVSVTQNADHAGSIAFEDSGAAILSFENGIIATIHFSINSYGRNREGSLTILGDKGTVKIGGEYLNTIEYHQFASHQLEMVAESAPANDYGSYQGSMSNHDQVYDNIADSLVHHQPFYATAFEGLKTVEIIRRIYEAANRSSTYI